MAQRAKQVRCLIRQQMKLIESYTQGGTGLMALWDEYFIDPKCMMKELAQSWLRERIEGIKEVYEKTRPSQSSSAEVFKKLVEIEKAGSEDAPPW
jgi:hypothetical protein